MPYRTPDLDSHFHEQNALAVLEWITEHMPGGFFIYRADESMELIFANSACRRLYGCDTAEDFFDLTGHTFRGMVHPDDFEQVQASIHAQIADEKTENMDAVEYRIVRRDGSVRRIDDYGHYALLPGVGGVYYVFIVDVTEKQLQRDAHSRSLNVYESLLAQFDASAGDSLTAFRNNLTTGRIEQVSGTDLYDTDYPGGSIAASARVRAESLLLPDERAEFEAVFQPQRLLERYRDGAGPAVFVGFCRRPSGRLCFVRFTRTVVPEPATGDLISFGFETEYNDGRVIETLNQKVLAQQYDMVTYLFGNSYGVVIGDAANIKRGSIFPDRRIGDYTEYLRRQVLPAVDGTVHDRAQIALALSPQTVKARLAEREPYVVDVTCALGGETYNKRFTFFTVDRDADFYVLLKSDVTDVLREQRTRNLLLSDALREAERANEAKSAFLSSMSHEMRTPMNAILGLGGMALADPSLSPRVRAQLEKLNESANQLLGIINRVLDMSSLESGGLTLQNEPFSLSELLDRLCDTASVECGAKGLRFERKLPDSFNPSYTGDAGKLRDILQNVLSNAVKFTDAPGTVTLTVRQTAQFMGNAALRFTVTDTGIGIGEDFLPRIYEPFSQEDGSRSSKYGSIGLGLAITKNLVELMNGTISVRSQKGVGTEVTVDLTLRSEPAPIAPPAPASPEDADAPKTVSLEGRRILLAEDMPINAEIVMELLDMEGMTVDHAENGKRVVEMFEASAEGEYDAILMDIRMPVADGLAAARAIRALPRADAKTVPILALTANALEEDVQQTLQAGMNAHLTKPVDPDVLYEALEKYIGERNA